MGFLNNSTNNIIIDAVLTSKGRELLARNDGSFSIVKWAASDDEISYDVIQKYGRTIGKEKIEKNQPIFEALTNQNLAQKYRLVSISNPNLIRLPSLSLQGEGVDSNNDILTIGNTTVKRRTITLSQTVENEASIDVELRDQAFVVDMSDLFLQVVGSAPDDVDADRRATYILTRDSGENSLGGSRLTFTLSVKAITQSQFTIYGSTANKNTINTYVTIYGVQSGASKTFQVKIQKDS